MKELFIISIISRYGWLIYLGGIIIDICGILQTIIIGSIFDYFEVYL
jgi:hypothetical protein